MGGRGGEEWNGALAEEHVRRENAIHTQTRGVRARVCVCVGILNYNGLHLFQSAGETNTQDHKYWGPCPR